MADQPIAIRKFAKSKLHPSPLSDFTKAGFGSCNHIGITVCHTRMSREIAKRV
jgi:hypothetical protein